MSEALIDVLRGTPLVMTLLAHVRALELRDGWLAAGVIRSAYWAHLHQRPLVITADADVVFCDPTRPREDDAVLAARLGALQPDVQWEVTNQAHVHHWYRERFGITVAPFTSTAQGIAHWPETATCIGARLLDQLEITAPVGLADLLGLRWRANSACLDPTAFARRLAQKRPQAQWPLLTIVE